MVKIYSDLFSATSSLIWFHVVCKRTDRVGERKKQKHDRTVKKETKKGGGWTDEGKRQSLMCLGLVRSDSDGGRERKVKPKVAIIYLITDPSGGWRTCGNTHFSHSFCIFSSFLSCVSLLSFTRTQFRNRCFYFIV